MANKREERFLMRQRGAGRQLQDDDFGISLFGAAKSPAPVIQGASIPLQATNTATSRESPLDTVDSTSTTTPARGEAIPTQVDENGTASKKRRLSRTSAVETPTARSSAGNEAKGSGRQITSSGKKRRKRKSVGQGSLFKKRRSRLSQDSNNEEIPEQLPDNDSDRQLEQRQSAHDNDPLPAVEEEPEVDFPFVDEPAPKNSKPKAKARPRTKANQQSRPVRARKSTGGVRQDVGLEDIPMSPSVRSVSTPPNEQGSRLANSNRFAPLEEDVLPSSPGNANQQDINDESARIDERLSDNRHDGDEDVIPVDTAAEENTHRDDVEDISPKNSLYDQREPQIQDELEEVYVSADEGAVRPPSEASDGFRNSPRGDHRLRDDMVGSNAEEEEISMNDRLDDEMPLLASAGSPWPASPQTDAITEAVAERDHGSQEGESNKPGRRLKPKSSSRVDRLQSGEVSSSEVLRDIQEAPRERAKQPKLQSSQTTIASQPSGKRRKGRRGEADAQLPKLKIKENTAAFYTYVPKISDFPPDANRNISDRIPPLIDNKSLKPTPSAPDVLAHMADEVVELALSKILDFEVNSREEKAAVKHRHDAVKSFGEEATSRLRDISRVLSINGVLDRRVKHCKKARKELWAELLEHRSRREDVELGLFHIRGRHGLARRVREEDDAITGLIQGTKKARERGLLVQGAKNAEKVEAAGFALKAWDRLSSDTTNRKETALMDRIRMLNGILQKVIDE